MEKYSGIERKKLSEEYPDYFMRDAEEALMEMDLLGELDIIDIPVSHAPSEATEKFVSEVKSQVDSPSASDRPIAAVLDWFMREVETGDSFNKIRGSLEYDWSKQGTTDEDNEKLAREFAKEGHLKRNFVKYLVEVFQKGNFAKILKEAGLEAQRVLDERYEKLREAVKDLLKTNPPEGSESGSKWIYRLKREGNLK